MIESNQSKVKAFYDRQAKSHESGAAVLGEPTEFSVRYRASAEWATFRRIVRLRPKMRVVELGCGAGRWLAELSPKVGQVIGVELSDRCYALAYERTRDLDNVRVFNMCLEEFSLAADEVDLIYFSGVLLYLDDEQCRLQLARYGESLSKEGLIVIRDSVASHSTHDISHGEGYVARYRTDSDWRSLLKDAGFELMQQIPANANPLAWAEKKSRKLGYAFSVAKSLRIDELFLKILRGLRQLMQSAFVEDGYSHDFLVAKRQAFNSK
ncbi:MAG: class I SAM-dependent methyltransferase [Planctomycetaceae bacterium]|nr:class I SAM-dependent methyltransferase [Planctomycetaceae bacterium]